jgi:hypothetical protein
MHAMDKKENGPFDGIVEMDETYVGGKLRCKQPEIGERHKMAFLLQPIKACGGGSYNVAVKCAPATLKRSQRRTCARSLTA